MKKLLLFTFALFLWTGAWAQNLSLGKYVHLLANGVSGVTESSLQGLTNGNTTEDVPLATYDKGTSTLSPIQAFYIDLGEKKELSKVVIYWEGALCTNYSIKGSSTTANSESPEWDKNFGTYEVARGTTHVETHNAPNDFSTRYIKFEPANDGSTEGYSNPIWTVKMKEFEVIGTDAQVLSSVKLPYYVYSATQGYNINASVYDQFDMAFEGDVTLSWEGSAPVGAEINGKNIVFGAASGVGTYTLKATDGNTSVTTPIYMVANDDALITPTSNVVPIYAAGTDTEWLTNYNGGAKEDHSFTLGTTPVQSFYDTRCVFVTNKDLNAWNADVDPTEEGYGSIHFSIYSPIEGVKVNISFEGTKTIGNDHLMTLSQGWGEYSVSLVGETNIHTISIRNEQKSSSTAGPTIVVANVYYTKVAVDPATIESVKVTAASTSIAEYKTTQLTVIDQLKRDVTSLMTFGSSNTGVATVDENGLVTAVAKGSATITATVTGRDVSNTVEITVTEAELGFDLTADNHTIHVTPYHIAGTTTYKLVITSETETLTGMGGSFWHVKGNDATNTQMNTEQAMTVNNGVITVTGTFESAPVVYTPLYVMMPGQVTYTTGIENVDLDWIDVQKVTIGPAEWASFSSTNALDFGKVEGLKAYYATANDGLNISYNTVEKAPAGTGLILGGAQGNYDVPVIKAAPALSSTNLLQSTAAGAYTILEADANKVYVFGRIGSDIGFVKGVVGYEIGANKSYLRLTNKLEAKGFNFIGLPGSETDGINKVNTLVETGVRYNLAGQRVGNDYKGIVIVNGRKVVIK